MPPKRSNLGRRTRSTERRATQRRAESGEERLQRNESNRQRTARSRSRQTEEERDAHNTDDRLRMRRNRAVQDRSDETHQRNLNERVQRQTRATGNLHRAAFEYNNTIDYSLHTSVIIGTMNKVCQHCKALKFSNETPGICCANGKVKLPALNPPPEPLQSLVSGTAPQSKHFLTNIQAYNSCFQMTSFGATNIIRNNFMPTFKVISSYGVTNMKFDNCENFESSAVYSTFEKSDNTSDNITPTLQVQGQIYHKVGSLLPFGDANYHQFLQIYFIGNANDEVDQRNYKICFMSKMN